MFLQTVLWRIRASIGFFIIMDRRSIFFNLANSYYLEKDYSRALTLLDSAKAGLTQGQVYHQVEAFEKRIRINLSLKSAK